MIHTFRMPLYSDDERMGIGFNGFYYAVGGDSGGLKLPAQIADALVMEAVDILIFIENIR